MQSQSNHKICCGYRHGDSKVYMMISRPRWWHRKILNSPSPIYPLNLYIRTEKFPLKKNRGLTEQLLHNKPERKTKWKQVGETETIYHDYPSSKIPNCSKEKALGSLNTESPGDTVKNKNSCLKGTYAIWEGNLFTNPRVSAKLKGNCGNSLQCGRHQRVPFVSFFLPLDCTSRSTTGILASKPRLSEFTPGPSTTPALQFVPRAPHSSCSFQLQLWSSDGITCMSPQGLLQLQHPAGMPRQSQCTFPSGFHVAYTQPSYGSETQ